MRFEAARSSKSLFSALWIGPNSALSWRMSFRRVAKKKRKKSNNLARFYYMHTKLTFCPQSIIIKAAFFRPENHQTGLRESAQIFLFLLWTGRAPQFFTVEGETTTPNSFNVFLSETCTCSTIGSADSFKYPTEELGNCRFSDVGICPDLMHLMAYAKKLFSWRKPGKLIKVANASSKIKI